MESDTVKYRVAWDDTQGVAMVEWLPGSVADLSAAQAITDDLSKLDRGSVPLLVDMRHMSKFERGAREHFIAAQDDVSAIALLVDSPVTRMMANFFIGMRRMDTPIKMFADSSEALRWLHQQTR